MRRRHGRRWAACCLAAVLGFFLLPAPTASAAVEPAVADYGGCLLAQKAGDLLILLDDSGSLGTTDSQFARVDAAIYLVNQLLNYAQDNKVKLDVGVAAFDDAYHEAGPWTALDANGVTQVRATLEGFKTRPPGFETDYWMGLDGAQQALAQKAGANRSRCQAVVWFTDGQLTVQPRDTAAKRKAHDDRKIYAPTIDLSTETGADQAAAVARDDLCRDGGPADQLRASHVTIFAMGLSPNQNDPAFALMRRIAEGGSPACGKIKTPPGKFWPVGDIDQMLAAFDQVANPGGQQVREFVLDDALTRVHIFGTGKAGLSYTLVAPGQPGLTLPTGSGQQKKTILSGGVEVTWQWLSDQSLTVDLRRRPGKNWTGLWRVDIVDASNTPSGPDPTIRLSGDLYPAWAATNAPKLVSGDQPAVSLGMADADGQTIQPQALLGTTKLDATFIGPDGSPSVIGQALTKDQITKPRRLDLSKVPPGPGTVRLELTYTTAPAGGKSTTLDPQQVDVPVTILPAPGRGLINGDFQFGASQGPVDSTASVNVTGPSCVWVTPTTEVQTGPAEDISPVTITSDHNSGATCLSVPEGQTAPLTARLTTGAAGNGHLQGTVEVNQAPLGQPEKASAVQILFDAQMSKPLKVFNFLLALIVAVLLGPGIPLALLYLLKFVTAKIPGHPLEAIRLPVTIDQGQVSYQGAPLTYDNLPRAEAVDLLRRGSRSTTAAGIELRTRAGKSPFGAGFVEAVLPSAVGVSSSHVHPYGKRRAARLPLAVHNTWAAFHDPSGPAENATVLLLRGLDVTTDQRRAQLDDLRQHLPSLVSQLRPPGGPTPGAGGPGTPPDPGAPAAPGPSGTVGSGGPTGGAAPDFDFGFGDDGDQRS